MILPSEILPEALGLAWGMESTECLRVLGERGRRLTEQYAAARVEKREGPDEIYLRFDEGQCLQGLEAVASMDDSPWVGTTAEQAEEIYGEYRHRYARIVEQYLPLLGPASFSGDWQTEGFPHGYLADEITYWDTPAGRIMVRWEHQDKELPIMLIVATYPPGEESSDG